MKKSEVKIGMVVTCKYPESAYGSGYAHQPVCNFEPGMTGIVGATDVAYVRHNATFVCVDFFKAGVYPGWGQNNHSPWRVGLDYDNIVIVKDEATIATTLAIMASREQ